MTTSYYYLQEPIERVEVSADGDRERVRVWIGGQPASWLLPPETARDLALALAEHEGDQSRCPVFWSSAGMRENVRGLDPALTLVSESGEVVTVGQLRAEAEAMPKTRGAQ